MPLIKLDQIIRDKIRLEKAYVKMESLFAGYVICNPFTWEFVIVQWFLKGMRQLLANLASGNEMYERKLAKLIGVQIWLSRRTRNQSNKFFQSFLHPTHARRLKNSYAEASYADNFLGGDVNPDAPKETIEDLKKQ